MFCIKCGNQIPDEAKFCPKCGQAVQGNVEEKVEEKVEKKTVKTGKIPPVLKIILIVVAVIAAINVSVMVIGEYWKFAEIPNPEQYFGLEAEDIGGGEYYDKGWQFESEWDPWPVIEQYVEYLDNHIDDLLIYQDNPDGKVRIQIMYRGDWIFSDSPSLEIDYYGRNYYGENSKNQNNVFRIYIDNNFRFVDSECYAGNISEDDSEDNAISNNTTNENTDETEKESEQTSTKPVIEPMTIPDPCMFLGCQKNDSHETNDGEAWLVACTFSIDGAEDALNELMELLTSEEYKLKLIDSEEEDYVGTSAQYFYYFYFDYTGDEPEVEGFEYFTGVVSDVALQVVYNYSSGSVDLRMRHDDALTLVDSQKQATVLPESYSGTYTPGGNSSSNDYYKPDHSKLDCTFCNDGDCPKCDGYGKVKYYSGDGEYVESLCPDCRGSRKCKHCNGTGKREN